MKYLKSHLIYESKLLDPIEEFIVPLLDLGFKVKTDSNNPGFSYLSIELDNPSDGLLSEIFSEYLTLIDRLKEEYVLTNHSILFGKGVISIEIKRKIKDIFDEVQMTPAQKTAYLAVLSALKPGEFLEVRRITTTGIQFDKKYGISGDSMWTWIHDNGQIDLPILRGRKSQSRTELPFDSRDVNWFKRIIIDNSTLERKEFDTLHSSSQEVLRQIYKV